MAHFYAAAPSIFDVWFNHVPKRLPTYLCDALFWITTGIDQFFQLAHAPFLHVYGCHLRRSCCLVASPPATVAQYSAWSPASHLWQGSQPVGLVAIKPDHGSWGREKKVIDSQWHNDIVWSCMIQSWIAWNWLLAGLWLLVTAKRRLLDGSSDWKWEHRAVVTCSMGTNDSFTSWTLILLHQTLLRLICTPQDCPQNIVTPWDEVSPTTPHGLLEVHTEECDGQIVALGSRAQGNVPCLQVALDWHVNTLTFTDQLLQPTKPKHTKAIYYSYTTVILQIYCNSNSELVQWLDNIAPLKRRIFAPRVSNRWPGRGWHRWPAKRPSFCLKYKLHVYKNCINNLQIYTGFL